MAFTLRTCRCCGRLFPLLNDRHHDLCSDCHQDLQVIREELDWRNITLGYSCPKGKCEL